MFSKIKAVGRRAATVAAGTARFVANAWAASVPHSRRVRPMQILLN